MDRYHGRQYPAVVTQYSDHYDVYAVDLPHGGCGDTLEEAVGVATESLSCGICELVEQGKPVPGPSDDKEAVVKADKLQKEIVEILADADQYIQRYMYTLTVDIHLW
jgi:predicted RNase H-like HicB family nuclease